MDADMNLEHVLEEIRSRVAIELEADPKRVTITASFSTEPLFNSLRISWGIKHTESRPFAFSNLLLEPDEFTQRFIMPAIHQLRAL
jgi:hypothetical protein